jgi:hypothetical protein
MSPVSRQTERAERQIRPHSSNYSNWTACAAIMFLDAELRSVQPTGIHAK